MTAACEAALSAAPAPRLFLLCDGDLGESAGRLGPLVEAVGAGECDLAVAAFARRVGGGFGLALGFARWAERRLCGFEARAPISGQRAMRADVLRAVLPFARGFGMEIGMTVDAVRAGYRVGEYESTSSTAPPAATPAASSTAPSSSATSPSSSSVASAAERGGGSRHGTRRSSGPAARP